jgi:hypothetical protein
MGTIVSEIHTALIFRPADNCSMNLHLRGIWTYICHVHAPTYQLAGICALSLRHAVGYSVPVSSQDEEQQTTCIYCRLFFLDFFERHDETCGCNRKGSLPHFYLQVTVDLNQCYGNHWIGHGGPRAGHPAHRTWFLLLRIRGAFDLSRESAGRWWTHKACHGLWCSHA